MTRFPAVTLSLGRQHCELLLQDAFRCWFEDGMHGLCDSPAAENSCCCLWVSSFSCAAVSEDYKEAIAEKKEEATKKAYQEAAWNTAAVELHPA